MRSCHQDWSICSAGLDTLGSDDDTQEEDETPEDEDDRVSDEGDETCWRRVVIGAAADQ